HRVLGTIARLDLQQDAAGAAGAEPPPRHGQAGVRKDRPAPGAHSGPERVTAAQAQPAFSQAARGVSAAGDYCSGDLLSDGWGGQWFKDTQCLSMCDRMYFPECNSNWGWADIPAARS